MNSVTGLGKYLYAIPMVIFGVFHFLGANDMAAMAPFGGIFIIYFTGIFKRHWIGRRRADVCPLCCQGQFHNRLNSNLHYLSRGPHGPLFYFRFATE